MRVEIEGGLAHIHKRRDSDVRYAIICGGIWYAHDYSQGGERVRTAEEARKYEYELPWEPKASYFELCCEPS